MSAPGTAGIAPKNRAAIIVQLLERYDELVNPLQVRAAPGDGIGLPLMPATYTASVRELEHLLIRMRAERRSQWWHVTERYIRCTHKQRQLVRRGDKWVGLQPHEAVISQSGGWTVALAAERNRKKPKGGEPVDVTVAAWNHAVRVEKVRRGVDWLANEWSLPFEPMLPRELQVAA